MPYRNPIGERSRCGVLPTSLDAGIRKKVVQSQKVPGSNAETRDRESRKRSRFSAHPCRFSAGTADEPGSKASTLRCTNSAQDLECVSRGFGCRPGRFTGRRHGGLLVRQFLVGMAAKAYCGKGQTQSALVRGAV